MAQQIAAASEIIRPIGDVTDAEDDLGSALAELRDGSFEETSLGVDIADDTDSGDVAEISDGLANHAGQRIADCVLRRQGVSPRTSCATGQVQNCL